MEGPMAIDKKLIDQLLTDYKKPEDIIRENGLLKELTKAIRERALAAEMTDHLGAHNYSCFFHWSISSQVLSRCSVLFARSRWPLLPHPKHWLAATINERIYPEITGQRVRPA